MIRQDRPERETHLSENLFKFQWDFPVGYFWLAYIQDPITVLFLIDSKKGQMKCSDAIFKKLLNLALARLRSLSSASWQITIKDVIKRHCWTVAAISFFDPIKWRGIGERWSHLYLSLSSKNGTRSRNPSKLGPECRHRGTLLDDFGGSSTAGNYGHSIRK